MLSINIDIDYSTNPKIERLTEILGDGSEIHLIRLWAYCAKHCRKTGGREDWSGEALETTVRWSGEKGLLVETLLKLKLIHRWKKGFKVHDWSHHAAHLIAYDDLCEMNRKKVNKRWEKHRKHLRKKNNGEDTDGIPPVIPKSEIGNTKTKLNKTKPPIEDFEPSSTEIHEASMSSEREEVFSYWVEARAKAGMKTLTSQEKSDASKAAAYILHGVFSIDDFKCAVDNLMSDSEQRIKYGLRGLINNIDKWINTAPESRENRDESFGLSLSEIMRQQGIVPDAG